MKRIKGFTLVELITVISIIGVIAALLIPSLMEYVEMAANKTDVANAKRIYSILQESMMLSPSNTINYDNPWGNDAQNKDHGYVYIDDDEIRVSSMDIAEILVEHGIIKKSAAADIRQGKEPQFSKKKINVTCRSRKTWERYQINFIYKDGDVEFSYTACKKGKNKDADTSRLFAEKASGNAEVNISMGGKN